MNLTLLYRCFCDIPELSWRKIINLFFLKYFLRIIFNTTKCTILSFYLLDALFAIERQPYPDLMRLLLLCLPA